MDIRFTKKSNMRILLIAFLLQITFLGYSQINHNLLEFEQAHHQHATCGLSKEVLEKCKAPILKNTNLYPASSQFTCGKFKVYYADFLPGAPAVGFADPSLGEVRRNTFCAVLTYVQSVFDFSNVPADDPIRIEVEASFATVANPAPSNVNYYAYAGPTYYFNSHGTIEGGSVFDYITTGTSIVPSNGFHALMKVNFDKTFYNGYPSLPIDWLNNYTENISNCKLDLFSILLHEVGHMLGFISLANNNGQLAPQSVFGNNNFSRLDNLLHVSNGMTVNALQKFILSSQDSSFLNPNFYNTSLDNNNFWVNGNLAPNNHPVYSGSLVYYNISQNSLLSHLDDQILSYSKRSRNAPGYNEDYVMGPYGLKGIKRRVFSESEINVFIQLGFELNPVYPVFGINNHAPYSITIGNAVDYPMLPLNQPFVFVETINADTLIVNNVGVSVTFNLWEDTGLIDLDDDEITVADGTLTNIRGCGNGGNNHGQINLSLDKKSITFTPRANFIGRAQFAFKLFDGKKVGSWHLYTVDVLTGNNVNYPVGSNLLINGNLEEGTEVRRIEGEEDKPYTSSEKDLQEGFIGGLHYSDANPYNSASNCWWPKSGGDIIRNASSVCNPSIFGSNTNSFPAMITQMPLPFSNIGDRYKRLKYLHNYFGLGTPLQKCHNYILKFDYYVVNDTTYTFSFGFTNIPTYPSQPNLVDSLNDDLSYSTNGVWLHKEIPFNYCSDIQTNFLWMNGVGNGMNSFIDNIEIIEITNIPELGVSINGDSIICDGSSTLLEANVSNSFCNPSYLWSNGATTSSILITPISTQIYTVTVNDGCNSTTSSKTVQILDSIARIPIFNQSSLLCIEEAINPLPTISSNFISGFWYPDLNDTVTTTYTFVPFSDQCAVITTQTVLVNSYFTPIFNQLAPICLGAQLSELPTTSTNGITGTWSPALNNTATTTYTFTPEDGQCGLATNMTIIVNPNIIPTFNQIAPICFGDSLNELPITSTNGILGTWSHQLSDTLTTTYIFSPDEGQCGQVTNMTIIVNPNITPTFNQIAPICLGEQLSELPTTSTNGIMGTWSPQLNNTATTAYTFTPNNGQCTTSATMVVNVLPSPIATILQGTGVYAICQGDSIELNANLGIDLSYQWLIDGQTISGATSSNYIVNSSGNYSVRVSLANNCFKESEGVSVNVYSNTPIFTQVPPICSGEQLNDLPAYSTNWVFGTWSPPLNNMETTTYTFTPDDGQCGIDTSMTITVISSPNDSISTNGSSIICQDDSVVLYANSGIDLTYQWNINGSNILGATESSYLATTPGSYTVFITNSSNCAVLSEEIVLTTSSYITPAFNQIAPIISGTPLNELPTTSTNGIIGTWSPALNNTATTMYNFTPTEGQCASSTSMTIIVNPAATDFSWMIYPSPTNGSLTIQLSGLKHDTQLLIIDSRGRLVRKLSIPKNTESFPLDISALAAGEYFLQVENEGLKEKRKIVKF